MFKKYLGKTFIEFLTEIRIEKAKELLRNTNMKTYEIARCIGYRDAHYFSLIFRKTAGEPPSVYRTGNKDETAKD
jgi:two-component system response regulator YesN